jgi:hypothetical protein
MIVLKKLANSQGKHTQGDVTIVGPSGSKTIVYGDEIFSEPGWYCVIYDKKPTAVMGCPKCRYAAYLIDHQIAADGTVTPSCVCPRDGCGWHETVKLEGWE